MATTTHTEPRPREKLRLEPVTPELLAEIVRRIVEAVDPDKIILFGSYAKGNPREYSDVDLYIIKPGQYNRLTVAAHLESLFWDMSLPIDFFLSTPEQVARELALGNSFIRDHVLGKGRPLYERPDGAP